MKPGQPYASFVPSLFPKVHLGEYLFQRFPYHSREEWSELILAGRVTVNGNREDQTFPLSVGDRIEYLPFAEKIKEPEVNSDYSLLFESDEYLIVDKPANLPVHPAGRYRTRTLLTFLEKERGEGTCFPVHRLDRETSGVIVFAKTKDMRGKLQTLWEAREVEKKYLALVYGAFSGEKVCEGFIGKDKEASVRKKQKYSEHPFEDSKPCRTDFSPLLYDSEKNISLVLAKPVTGRIHQIRASLLGNGFPLVGDKLYGKRESAFLDFIQNGDADRLNVELGHHRQCLHAFSVSFTDPNTQKRMEFVSSLAKDLCPFFPFFDSKYVT
ncbi:RluA family pseudouridine synthase [Leptospira idonii]|uniref:RluA family pseudouridine synthase n=1 Tax=Leptospira idonii TaxID=1193500 RepID=UPI001FE46B0A|nr:RluA family pseudouridine synthase [Leptospira idonii]